MRREVKQTVRGNDAMQTGAARPVVQGVLLGLKVQEFYAPAGG